VAPERKILRFSTRAHSPSAWSRATRAARIARINGTSDFRERNAASAFRRTRLIPENPTDPPLQEVVEAVRQVAAYCRKNGQTFRCETGQETPISVATIHGVGQTLQLEPPPILILYGKANPVEALDVLGPLVMGCTRQRTACTPGGPRISSPRERRSARARSTFRDSSGGLKEIGYTAHSPSSAGYPAPAVEDIRAAKAYLEKLIG